jgi:hypothetical protein
MAFCVNHPEAPGVGVCVRCRAVICAACTTRLDGVNHCHQCLEELALQPEPVRESSRLGRLVVLLLACASLWGLLWLARGNLMP